MAGVGTLEPSLTPSQRLLNAAGSGDAAELRGQLSEGGDPNACDPEGVSAIGIAASRGWVEGVAVLLKAGADPSQQVHSPSLGTGSGPLLTFPASNGSLEVVRLLVDAGAPVDDADPTGLTPLMAASYMGRGAIVAFLCAAGASLERQDQEGYTALMFAANAGSLPAVEALVGAGAGVSPQANDGSTAIMFAAQHGHDAVVSALLRSGADPKARGSHGLSAIGFAQQNGHKRTLGLLLGTGSKSR